MSTDNLPDAVSAFTVVKGKPSDADLAAISVVLAALRRSRGNPHAPEAKARVGGWTSYWHNLRHPAVPGSDAWRSTFRR